MKKFVVALTAAAMFAAFPAFALAAPAADPQTTVAVKEMLEAMEMRKNMLAMYGEMQKAMPGIMRQQMVAVIQSDARLSAEQKKEAIDRADKSVPRVSQALGKIFSDPALVDEMITEIVPLYANNYTTAEIRQLTVFYK
ncbi:MAG: DUF2059 domain-containing protein, partial [Telluria sp.]